MRAPGSLPSAVYGEQIGEGANDQALRLSAAVYYKELALSFARNGASVELLSIGNENVGLPTLRVLPQLTGGSVLLHLSGAVGSAVHQSSHEDASRADQNAMLQAGVDMGKNLGHLLRRDQVRMRFHVIRHARIENVGKSQSCMVSKLRIIRNTARSMRL